MASLDHRLARPGHVVSQIVEAEFGVGPVRDVRGISRLLGLEVRHLSVHSAYGQTEEVVDTTHPLGVALHQVGVHRDHVHATTG